MVGFRTAPALRASAASHRPAPAGGPRSAKTRNFRSSHPLQYKYNVRSLPAVMRSYQGYYTRSHQNSEVKRLWAGIVLGWVTSREVPVLHPLLRTPLFCIFLHPCYLLFLLFFLPLLSIYLSIPPLQNITSQQQKSHLHTPFKNLNLTL